jgi:hypothetical protein
MLFCYEVIWLLLNTCSLSRINYSFTTNFQATTLTTSVACVNCDVDCARPTGTGWRRASGHTLVHLAIKWDIFTPDIVVFLNCGTLGLEEAILEIIQFHNLYFCCFKNFGSVAERNIVSKPNWDVILFFQSTNLKWDITFKELLKARSTSKHFYSA